MPSYNVTSPDGKKYKINAPEGATKEQVLSYAQENFKAAPKGKPVSKMESFAGGIKDMASFGFDDELRGFGKAIGNKLAGREMTIDQGIDFIRQESANQQEQNPKSYIAGQITGGILPAIATRGKSLVNIGGPVTKAAISGGIQGGAYGLGTGEDSVGNRLEKAAEIGSIGAVGGAGISYGLSLLGRALGSSASKLAGGLDKIKGTAPEAVDDATKKIIDKIRVDFPDDQEFAKALSSMAQGSSLAEIAPQGGQLQRLTRGAAQYPSGEKAITEALTDRTSGTTQRIKQGIKDYVSPNTDYYGTIENITQKGQAKAKPLYEKSYGQTVDLGETAPEIQQAIQKARSQYPSELRDLPDNSVKVLDYAKRVLDDDIGVAKRAGEGNFARSRTLIKNDLLAKIDQSSPEYAKARAVSGDYLSNSEALDTGREFLKMDADTIGRTFKKFNDGQKESFKAGIARSIRDTIDNSNDGSDIAKKILGKEEVRNKLKSVMSPKEYDELANTIRAEEKIFKLQKFVLGNSTTTSKAMDAADLSSEAQEVLQTLATQGPLAATSQQVVKAVRKTFSGLNDRTAGQVAKILMETDPQKKLALLNKVKSLPKGESQKMLEAFFETNQAVNSIRKAGPTPDLIGKGAATMTGTADEKPRITIRPSDRNLTTTQP